MYDFQSFEAPCPRAHTKHIQLNCRHKRLKVFFKCKHCKYLILTLHWPLVVLYNRAHVGSEKQHKEPYSSHVDKGHASKRREWGDHWGEVTWVFKTTTGKWTIGPDPYVNFDQYSALVHTCVVQVCASTTVYSFKLAEFPTTYFF